MSPADTRNEQLQDFLDERLSPAERAAFVRELEEDPGLRAELSALEAVRAALRDTTDADLPGGLVAGARARFEAGRRGAPRHGLQWLSWEAVGLAAAALLAVAVFLPGWLRQDFDPALDTDRSRALPAAPAQAGGESSANELRDSAKDELSSSAAPDRGPQSLAKGEEGAAPPLAGLAAIEATPEGEIESADPEDSRQRVERRKTASAPDRAQAAPPAAPVPSPPTPERTGRAAASAPGAEDRARQREAAVSDVDAPNRGDEAAKKQGLGLTQEPRSFAVAVHESSAIVNQYALAPGRIEPGTWRIAEREEPGPPGRWLLVGPREAPFVCSGATVELRADGYHVRLARPAPGTEPSFGGCAIQLPDDDVPVIEVETIDG